MKTTNVVTSMKFEWDAVKAKSNKDKHGLSFEVAAMVFLDPNRVDAQDHRKNYGEDRWKTVGPVQGDLQMQKNESSMVKFTLDPSNPPKLTMTQQAELAALREKTDDNIDYSDIPALDDAFWASASRALPAHKKQVTLRIDEDVLDFFKGAGSRYQTRINAVLRAYVDATKDIMKATHK